ncbi:MAG: long-chain fatty acid--CoA ligase [Bacteroidetes bacterium SW_10_40_5]|nr:MAG: long-chain fatty acid--CoA ligase [Bacteroidetes bacterium SW_10_40_5]
MAAIKTLIDILPYQLKHFPQEDALAYKVYLNQDEQGQWDQFSSLKCMDYINKVSKGLLVLGIQPGDKIAIVSENRPEWVFIDMAVLQLGAVNVPVYPTISEDDYKYIFEEAEVKYAFASNQELYNKAIAAQQAVPTLKNVFTFDEIEGASHWKELIEMGEKRDLNELVQIREKVTENDLATIIYTSGTTGNPKGVMLSHKNIVSNVLSCAPLLPVNYHHRAISFLPLNHVFERMLTYLYMSCGVSIYFAEHMDKIGENIREIQPHVFTTVPRLMEKVYDRIINKGRELSGLKKTIFFRAVKLAAQNEVKGKSWWYHQQLKMLDQPVFKKWREALGGNVKAIVSGGAALSPHLSRTFTAAGVTMLQGYGLTETSPVIAVNRMEKENRQFGTVGPPIEGVEVKITEQNEIACRGPNVMKGYYKNEEATNKVIDADGWFYTGDVGEWVEGKFLKVNDRKDSLFKTSGGKFVAPLPIENMFKQSRFIEQIMVIGKGRKFIAALLLPDFGELENWCKENKIDFDSKESMIQKPEIQQKYQETINHYNKNLGHVQQVKKFKLITDPWSVDTGELTPTMKIKREVVLQKYKDVIEEMYAEDNNR